MVISKALPTKGMQGEVLVTFVSHQICSPKTPCINAVTTN